MSAALDHLTAARLLKLRIVLAGEGGFRLQPSGGDFGAICMLPGSGRTVRLFRGFGGKPMAQIHLADRQPRDGLFDLSTSADFATLFEHCDGSIWQDGCAVKGAPTEIRRLANWAVASLDPTVEAAVDVLWGDGEALDWRHGAGPWTPSSAAWLFVRICAQSTDSHVRKAAEALKAVIRREVASAPHNRLAARIDTGCWIAYFISATWLARREELRTPSSVWVRLKTHDDVEADARVLGRRKEEFLDGLMPSRLTPHRRGVRLLAAADAGKAAGAGAANRRPEEGVEIWSLRDATGRLLSMACIAQGDIIVCGRQGRDLEALTTHLRDVAILRRARLPREQAEGI